MTAFATPTKEITMKARFLLDNEIYELTLSSEHSAASYEQPVAVTSEGTAIDAFSWAFYEVVDATGDELDAFAAAGYVCPDML